MEQQKEWFSTWFDTHYYHLLYKDRDYSEAELFINNLISYLQPASKAHFLDLACGKGRHAVFLNKKGYHVMGCDLSEQNISFAKQQENQQLKFTVQDMRNQLDGYSFDYILNLFTSFGYFDEAEDDQKVIDAVTAMLNPKGVFVLDYLNIDKLIENIVPFEIKEVEGIEFEIKRYLENGFIHKEIRFKDKGEKYQFVEKVKALDLDDFKQLFQQAGLKIKDIFGDYLLNEFNSQTSERLIVVLYK